jgi:formylglycine-generating enzyme
MNSTTSAATSMFEKVLRAFETRGITYSDVLAQLRRQLAAGAAPRELLAVLRRRESTEWLPEYVRVEALLLEAERSAAQNADPDSASGQTADSVPAGEYASAPAAGASTVVSTPNGAAGTAALEPDRPDDEMAVDMDFDAPGKRFTSSKGLRASELDLSVLAKHLRSVDERSPPRGAALEALTRSYERAREGEFAAAERATALAADLEAARTALQAELGKIRDIEQALAQSVESGEAVRAEALRETQRYRAELSALRDSLAERDARIATLSRERTVLEATLEARAKGAAELEADLRTTRARAEAATSELRASRDAAAALDAQVKRGGSHLDAARKELDAKKEQAVLYLELLRNRAWRRGFDQNQPEPPPPRSWMRAPARAIGWGAAAALLAVFAWLFAHHSPPPPTAAVSAASAALPNPGTVIHDCSDCPGMTVLPAGRFKQGSAGGSAFAQPLHWVVIRRPIAMSTNPVTLEDFGQFVAATGRDMQGCDTYDGDWKQRPGDSWERPGFAQTGTHPVTCVSWKDAEAYATWLSTKTGHRYRLPSASEWEYAARAGNESAQPWGPGGQDACASANVADTSAGHHYPGWTIFPCDDGYVYTAPVGAFQANSFGLNDMLGNVLQWTEDCWHENYLGAPIDGSARSDGDCSLREIRGGSWFSNPAYVRADYRDRFPADYRTSSVGIRLVRDI